MRFLLLSIMMLSLHISVWAKDIDERLRAQIVSCLGTDRWTIVKTTDTYSIVEGNEGEGFVIFSLCGSTKRRILGYVKNSTWNDEGIPPVLLGWLTRIGNNQIEKDQVNDYEADTLNKKPSIAPLLTCHWHQRSPYNDLSPVITDGNVKTVAGCVAIAAAQITYYWRKDNPEYTLRDTPVYPYGGAPVIVSIPRGTANNWELMLDSYTDEDSPESRYAVAQLCYVIGTTSYLNYASSTGGHINDASNAMYAQYDLLSNYVSKAKYEQAQWDSLIYSDLRKGYPIMCGGGGHAYVLDGYDSNTDLYHINFGWGGSWDGYYPIDDTEESMGGYADGVSIVYDIHPKVRNITTDMKCLYEDGKVDVDVSVRNESTLPIKELYLYACNGNGIIDEHSIPLWHGNPIENDGENHQVSFSIDYLGEGSVTLCLTDENQYVLAKDEVDIKSGIEYYYNKPYSPEEKYYDINGQRVYGILKPGVYIRKIEGQTSKIIIK